MSTKPDNSHRRPQPETETRYVAALELYRGTDLTIKAICERCGVSAGGFRAYLYRFRRDLVFARHGITLPKEEAVKARLRNKNGPSPATRARYKDAVEACDNAAYIEFNVSQIAYLFGLNPTGLGNQLRHYYPGILEWREKVRHRLGINDNLHRGVKTWCKEQYAEATEHLRTTDDTIRQTADLYNLSYPGLREHLLYYCKDLIRERANKRRLATTNSVRGGLTGNGGKHEPMFQSVEKYREAVRLYRTTAMTQKEICTETGVTVTGLRNYLRIWHKDLILEHRDMDCRRERARLSGTKRYLKSTAAKYAEAIVRLKTTGRSTAKVAQEFGLNPETFRKYLYEHEPELAAALGKTRLANNRQVLVRSAEKYDEAIRLYETTPESLKSIARRLGLQYNSVGGFVRRNRPDAIEAHNRLLKKEGKLLQKEETLQREKKQAESAELALKKEVEEKERILRALNQTGGHKRNTAKLLGIGKTTLYNKLQAYDLIEKTCPKHIVADNRNHQDTA